MANDERKPLYYTFGNHMHWVDMEWLWGYQVLPDSVRDMLHFCTVTGTRGNINFDAIGYEKLAVESPAALQQLREAIAQGQIEVVGASYGQPYGLFHGGESNVRQRAYGVRTVLRLLGVRPRTFWEEEFDFCPQLPQMLRGVGYTYGSLFFQWTWHTPVVPHEELPAVWWEGMDGSRLLTATRNALNLHQWPEDFAGLLDGPAPREMPAAGIVQWLELMPSPDWMCRSELLLPQLHALLEHPEFELRPATLSEYLEVTRPHAEVRRYTMDDVFHGMSLGKNGDAFRRLSRRGEHTVLSAEAFSALAGLAGRPYPSWNVYPTWELEEAWRELLAAQHHDNDECEGLCGFVGRHSYERSLALSEDVRERTLRLLAGRTPGEPGRLVAFNPLGWPRDVVVVDPATGAVFVMRDVPPFGYRVAGARDRDVLQQNIGDSTGSDNLLTLQRGGMSVVIDGLRGVITQISSDTFPEGMLSDALPLGSVSMLRDGQHEVFGEVEAQISGLPGAATVEIRRRSRDGATLTVTISIAPELDAVDLHFVADALPRPDGLMHAALMTPLGVAFPVARLIHDHPYGVSEIRAEGTHLRKYPTGDWMTSPQVFEEVHNPFTALQLLDFDAGERGLLVLHDGSQALVREGEQVRMLLSMYDPWDEDYFDARLDARIRLVPHGPLSHTRRWRLAQEFTRPALVLQTDRPGGDLPATLAPVWCEAPNVSVTALFRETEESGAGLVEYAGTGIGFPYVLRLVELDGVATTAHVRALGPVAAAFRTNILGEDKVSITVAPVAAPPEMPGAWAGFAVELRPHEIATVYLDLVQGRKVARNLDDYRSVWATVHRVGETA